MLVAKNLLLKKIEKPIALGCIGFFVGILLANLAKGLWLKGGLFDVDSLYYMKYMTMDKGAYFGFVLWKRWKVIGVLLLLSTTYLGRIVGKGSVLCYSAGYGAFLSVFSIRYGVKGCLFGLLSIFPHFLIYLPAFVALLFFCEELYFQIYHQQGKIDWKSKKGVLQEVSRLVRIMFAVLIGCVLEVYINTPLIMGVLKIF